MAPEKKRNVWGVRLSDTEVALIERAAEKHDKHPATVAREVLVRWAKRVLAA